MNIPNQLTLWRVIFAVIVFICIGIHAFDWALLFFVLASLTDFVDGWWARRFQQITVFGRIMDPFADKFLICGVFICLVALPGITGAGKPGSWILLQPWMVIVIVGRELLITSLRAFVEKSGADFSAKWLGKWKMGVQCLAVIACLIFGATLQSDHSIIVTKLDEWLPGKIWRTGLFITMIASIWITVLITLYSGLTYCQSAIKTIRSQTTSEFE